MDVSTFGITESIVNSYYPQIQVRSDGPIASADITEIINNASSKVNGLLTAAGYDPATIEAAAVTAPDPYNNVRTLILVTIGPLLYVAAEGPTVSSEQIEKMEERRDKALLDFAKRPASLGHTANSDYAPRVRGSVRYNDLSALEVDRAKRSQFGRLVGRTSENDRKPYW